MAVEERPTSGGGNGFLYFVVGALVVGVAVLAWFMFGQPATTDSSIDRMADSVTEAADSISDSARDAADNVTPPAPAPAPQQE